MSRLRVFRSVLGSVIFVALTAGPAYPQGPGTITAVAIDPLDPIALYAGTYGGGVFKSTDGGTSWSPTSLTNVFVWSMAIAPRASPADPTTVYAGASGGVFKSTDGGASWSPTSLTNALVGSIAIDPLTPTTLYAGAPGGVVKSTDGGTNWIWSPILSLSYEGVSAGVLSLAIDPLTPTTLFAGTEAITGTFDDGEIWSIGGGIFRSVDGGMSWGAILGAQLQFYGGPYDSVLALAIAPRSDPSTPATLYAGRGDVGLFKSGDGGTNWSPTGFQSYVWSLALDPLTPTTLYAGYFKSTDGGATWNRTGLTGVDMFALAIDPVTPTTLYAGTSGGVYKSVDGAENWNPTGPITWLHLSSVNLNPTSVVGGNASTGTVTLSAPAPIGGVAVALSSSNTAVATVPTSVTVTAGATSANFAVSTRAVTASTGAAIFATYGGVVGSGLTVTPATTLSSLSLNPASVTDGVTSTGTVVLSNSAPAGGAVVALYSSNLAIATVPPNVTVAAGATSGTFTVSSSVVTTSTAVWISATNGGITQWAALTVTPTSILSSVSLNPTSVTAGSPSTGTVTLSGAAPAGGAAVALSSNNPAVATVSPSLTVASGATSANFTVSTPACASGSATISGTYGDVTASADLTVTPAATDAITVQQADYFANKRELRVSAKSTNSTATLRVYVTSTGDLIGTLTKSGDGTYRGQFTWSANPQNITVRSSLCGSATKAVTSK